jgi:hypothetical protein
MGNSGMGAAIVDFEVSPNPEPDARAYVIETIKHDRDEMRRRSYVRKFVGPFASFEIAHDWMSRVGSKQNDTCIIHQLTAPFMPAPTVVAFPQHDKETS